MMNKKQIIFFCVAQVLCSCFGQDVTITYITPPQTKNSDESVTLNCTVVKPKDISVSWLKDGVTLTLNNIAVFRNPRYSIIEDASTNTFSFQIQNLTALDTGKYKCQVNLGVESTVAKEVDVQVYRPPIIMGVQDPVVQVKEGQAATLFCKADGFPKPAIVWKRDNEEIFFSKGNTFSGANLTILQVRKEDRGRYICEANNGIGETVSRSVSLEVSFGPIISSKRPRVGQKEGYEAELICIVSAYPPAAVSWFRDGKSINSDDHYQLSYLGKPNEETISTLKLKNVQSSLFGRYVCQGTNAYGAGETAMELFEQDLPNEIFSLFRKSNAHRFIGFHALLAATNIITIILCQ